MTNDNKLQQRQSAGSQTQSMGSMSQSQNQTQSHQAVPPNKGVGPSGHEIPSDQAGYGSSHDAGEKAPDGSAKKETGGSDDITAAEAALSGKAVPGEISPRPDEQARADANPQLYDG